MIAAHLSVSALPAEGTSVGRYVRLAVEVLKRSGLAFEVHAMGTEIECRTLAELFEVVRLIDERLGKEGAGRITLQLKIDHRLDRDVSLADKVKSATKPEPKKPR